MHVMFVKRVDQDDEPLGLIALGFGKRGDAVDDDCVKALGDLEIVGRAERSPAQRVEIEPRDAVDRLRDIEMAAEQLDLSRLTPRMAG